MKSFEYAEANFECFTGPSKSYFEIGNMRGVYVAYTAISCCENSLNKWLIESVFQPLRENGALAIFWRLPEKIEIHKEDDLYRIYTRIVAFDKNLSAVTIPDQIKQEGKPCRKLI